MYLPWFLFANSIKTSLNVLCIMYIYYAWSSKIEKAEYITVTGNLVISDNPVLKSTRYLIYTFRYHFVKFCQLFPANSAKLRHSVSYEIRNGCHTKFSHYAKYAISQWPFYVSPPNYVFSKFPYFFETLRGICIKLCCTGGNPTDYSSMKTEEIEQDSCTVGWPKKLRNGW